MGSGGVFKNSQRLKLFRLIFKISKQNVFFLIKANVFLETEILKFYEEGTVQLPPAKATI